MAYIDQQEEIQKAAQSPAPKKKKRASGPMPPAAVQQQASETPVSSVGENLAKREVMESVAPGAGETVSASGHLQSKVSPDEPAGTGAPASSSPHLDSLRGIYEKAKSRFEEAQGLDIFGGDEYKPRRILKKLAPREWMQRQLNDRFEQQKAAGIMSMVEQDLRMVERLVNIGSDLYGEGQGIPQMWGDEVHRRQVQADVRKYSQYGATFDPLDPAGTHESLRQAQGMSEAVKQNLAELREIDEEPPMKGTMIDHEKLLDPEWMADARMRAEAREAADEAKKQQVSARNRKDAFTLNMAKQLNVPQLPLTPRGTVDWTELAKLNRIAGDAKRMKGEFDRSQKLIDDIDGQLSVLMKKKGDVLAGDDGPSAADQLKINELTKDRLALERHRDWLDQQMKVANGELSEFELEPPDWIDPNAVQGLNETARMRLQMLTDAYQEGSYGPYMGPEGATLDEPGSMEQSEPGGPPPFQESRMPDETVSEPTPGAASPPAGSPPPDPAAETPLAGEQAEPPAGAAQEYGPEVPMEDRELTDYIMEHDELPDYVMQNLEKFQFGSAYGNLSQGEATDVLHLAIQNGAKPSQFKEILERFSNVKGTSGRLDLGDSNKTD